MGSTSLPAKPKQQSKVPLAAMDIDGDENVLGSSGILGGKSKTASEMYQKVSHLMWALTEFSKLIFVALST